MTETLRCGYELRNEGGDLAFTVCGEPIRQREGGPCAYEGCGHAEIDHPEGDPIYGDIPYCDHCPEPRQDHEYQPRYESAQPATHPRIAPE